MHLSKGPSGNIGDQSGWCRTGLGFLRGDFVWAAVRTVILAEEGRRKLPRKTWIVVSQDKTWCSGSPGSGRQFYIPELDMGDQDGKHLRLCGCLQ